MINQNIKFNQADHMLIRNGFNRVRVKGSHYIYKKDDKIVVLPIRLNPVIWNKILKENNIRGE